VNPEIAARLQSCNISFFDSEKGYSFLIRENCMAILSGASLGSSAIATDSGFAFLVWRDGQPRLAAHGAGEIPASPEQVETLRRFSEDLKAALNP
jgi:hypothetical protein